MSLSDSVIEGLGRLRVTQGEGEGSLLTVFPWQRRFIRGALQDGVEESALSVSRGCGKTTLCAGIATAALSGPLSATRGETVCVASSFDQSRLLFEHVLAFIDKALQNDRGRWRVQDSSNRATITDRSTGARVRCIGSDPRRAHGLAPVLILADEPAQWPENTSEKMIAALRTSLGKLAGSRLIALGTRPASREHWFEKMLAGGADYAQIHAAPSSAAPFQARTWRRANPSLKFMPNLEAVIRKEAMKARRDPAMLASFRALRLNQGLQDIQESFLLSADAWQRIERPRGAVGPAGGYVLGIDLGAGAAMSAAAAFWPESGLLDALAVFPTEPGLLERGLADGVGRRYSDMAARGELFEAGRRVSDVGALLGLALERWGLPDAVVCDRWREQELRQELEAAAFPLTGLVTRGMGFRDGGEDVRMFRGACLSDRVAPVESLLLRSAMSQARTVTDPAGNSKLSKSSEGGRRRESRDDAAAAAILAVAHGERTRERLGTPRRGYLGMTADPA